MMKMISKILNHNFLIKKFHLYKEIDSIFIFQKGLISKILKLKLYYEINASEKIEICNKSS